jgi:MazG family protein|tara:strand:+ start:426 stop:1235 length:810 start_codon:yes stop_codon:yes gene_type:complete
MIKIDKNTGKSFVKILKIMSALRDPKTGCEWDKDQDSNSIKSYCIEEAYEVVEAIENNDNDALCEELGDLLFQVIFHAEINNEKGNFSIIDVIDNLSKKLIRRHPHIFKKESNTNSKKQIAKNWINIKKQERIAKGNTGILDDIPKTFPAMIRSLKLQKRASENGFDWKNSNDTFKKIDEEKKELEIALAHQKKEEIEEEIGDLIFSIINLSRKLKIDPENALRKTNNKFLARINYIEKELKKENKKFNKSNLIELEKLWNQAKTDLNR